MLLPVFFDVSTKRNGIANNWLLVEKTTNTGGNCTSPQCFPSTPLRVHPERSQWEQYLNTSAPAKLPEISFAIGSQEWKCLNISPKKALPENHAILSSIKGSVTVLIPSYVTSEKRLTIPRMMMNFNAPGVLNEVIAKG